MENDIKEVGCQMIYLPSRRKNYFKYKKEIENLFIKNRYAAVWGNYSGLTNIDLLVLAKKYHVPVRIAHSHGSKLDWANFLMQYVVKTLHYFNKLRIDDYATSYWACSKVAGEFMFPKFVQNEVDLISNAVDTDIYYPDKIKRDEMRASLNINQEDIVIGHVARLCEVKNQFFLLKVVKEAVLKNPNAKLLLIGDGELRERVEQEIVNLNITENVIYLGERSDVSELLRAMDVFVLTSFSEGLSLSAVEAQASGVPCVLPTSVSTETDITGLVTFISLDEDCQVWAKSVLKQAEVKCENVKEKLIDKGFEICSAAQVMTQKLTGNRA